MICDRYHYSRLTKAEKAAYKLLVTDISTFLCAGFHVVVEPYIQPFLVFHFTLLRVSFLGDNRSARFSLCRRPPRIKITHLDGYVITCTLIFSESTLN